MFTNIIRRAIHHYARGSVGPAELTSIRLKQNAAAVAVVAQKKMKAALGGTSETSWCLILIEGGTTC